MHRIDTDEDLKGTDHTETNISIFISMQHAYIVQFVDVMIRGNRRQSTGFPFSTMAVRSFLTFVMGVSFALVFIIM